MPFVFNAVELCVVIINEKPWVRASVHAACTPINWPKDSQKYDIYTNEEGMYEIVFSSQQPKAKDVTKHCCNVYFLMFGSTLVITKVTCNGN